MVLGRLLVYIFLLGFGNFSEAILSNLGGGVVNFGSFYTPVL